MTIDVYPKRSWPEPTYIGDGVYAHFDGNNIWLGLRPNMETIAINQDNWYALRELAKKVGMT